MFENREAELTGQYSIEQILANPRFRAARNALLQAMLEIYEYDSYLTRLLLPIGRNVLFNVVMCLHARHDPNDPATWPTLRLVKQAMAGFTVGSPRRVADIVSRLIKIGYLEQLEMPTDRRVRILRPTEKMIAQDQDWLVSHYMPLQVMFPEPGYGPIMRRDPVFQQTQRLVSASLFQLGADLMARHPTMMQLMSREAGIIIFIKLMHLAGPAGDAAHAVSYSDLGTRFGVSRTQVRKLLREAEQNGLVHLVRDRDQFVQLTPKFIELFDAFIADSMVAHDITFQLAQRAFAATTQQRSMQKVPLPA
jgi:DNA-binding MarR family transcriptional regulator